jgi:hypothetical protein
MSNQHNRNFGKLIETKTNLSVSKFLQQSSSQGLTYCETGDLFGLVLSQTESVVENLYKEQGSGRNYAASS